MVPGNGSSDLRPCVIPCLDARGLPPGHSRGLASETLPQARRRPVTAGGRRRTTLGYAQDAGHPGGRQDLRAKTDTEAEHDVWQRHG